MPPFCVSSGIVVWKMPVFLLFLHGMFEKTFSDGILNGIAQELIVKKHPFLFYLASLLLFGSNGIVASFVKLPSTEIVFWRTGLGALLLILLLFCIKYNCVFRKEYKQLPFIIISGIAMGGSWMFLYEAYRQIGVSTASLLYYCGPVIIMIISPLLFKERLTIVKIVSFLIVLSGIILLNGTSALAGEFSTGMFYGLASAMLYSVMVIFNKKATRITGLENATIQLFVSFLTVAVFLLFRTDNVWLPPSNSWIALVLLGLINTGVGCWFYFGSIGKLPVQTVAVCGYLEPLSAVILAVLLLGESMTLCQMIGAVLIVGGAVMGEIRSKQFVSNKNNGDKKPL